MVLSFYSLKNICLNCMNSVSDIKPSLGECRCVQQRRGYLCIRQKSAYRQTSRPNVIYITSNEHNARSATITYLRGIGGALCAIKSLQVVVDVSETIRICLHKFQNATLDRLFLALRTPIKAPVTK